MELVEFHLARFEDLNLEWDPPDCRTARQYRLMRQDASRERRLKLNLAALATVRLSLMDRDDTLPRVLEGVERWLELGWQFARRLPCGPMIRVPLRFWMYRAAGRHYPHVGRLEWIPEMAALTAAFSVDPYSQDAARSLP